MKNLRLSILFLCFVVNAWSDSLRLYNDSLLQLDVQILDAKGKLLGEMTIAPSDSTSWSLDFEYFGYDAYATNPPTPYTVIWFCPSGEVYGKCTFVNSDSVVNANSCGGAQRCPKSAGK